MCVHAGSGLPYSLSSHREQADSFVSQAVSPQPLSHPRRVSGGSGSGLQSPPYDDHEEFDASLPTDELKSALFGPASSIRPHAQSTGPAASPSPTFEASYSAAAASASSSGQLQQQVQQQLQPGASQHSQDGAHLTFGSASIRAHQQASESFSGFAKQQRAVPHNARLWSIPVTAPKLANDFRLHTNPLAEDSSAGVSKEHFVEQLADEQSGHMLSLSELASMDPSSL